MINILIFTKDRACQLDALLRSIEENMKIDHKVTVLYNYGTEEFKAGYNKVFELFGNVSFIKETNFYKNSLDISLMSGFECVCWLCDDTVLKNPLENDQIFKRFMSDNSIGCYNIRMTPTMTHMVEDEPPHPIPTFGRDNTWEWRKAQSKYWAYPMCIDGHIYKVKDLVDYLPKLRFNLPPYFEQQMVRNPLQHPLMICNSQQKIIGISPNRVQTISSNKHGRISLEEMNQLWLSGKRIKLDCVYKLSEHVMRYHFMELEFEEV